MMRQRLKRTTRSRRQVLVGGGTVAGITLSGCLSGDDDTADGEEIEVGFGDSETTVNSGTFPDTLYVYCVQTGWSGWDDLMEAFEDEYGVSLNDDQRSSGEALTHMRSNAQNPSHGAFNGGYSFALEAWEDGFLTEYRPQHWDEVPDEFKTDDGHVTTTREMTTAVTYRTDIYEERGLDEPETWEDLKHPDLAQDLAFTPPHTANGLNAALSVNEAYGGSLEDVDPVLDYHEEIESHGADFRRNIDGDFTSGEISTVVETDYSGLNLKYNVDELDEEQVDVALLTGPDGGPGVSAMPYGFGLIEGGDSTEAAKLFMDYCLSDEGQQRFYDAYVRPVRADDLEEPDGFPEDSRYEETQFRLDQQELLERQEELMDEITERTPLPGAE